MGWTWINFQKFVTNLKFEFVMIKRDNASWFIIIILGNRAFLKIYYTFIPTNNNSNSYDDNNCKKQKKKSKC